MTPSKSDPIIWAMAAKTPESDPSSASYETDTVRDGAFIKLVGGAEQTEGRADPLNLVVPQGTISDYHLPSALLWYDFTSETPDAVLKAAISVRGWLENPQAWKPERWSREIDMDFDEDDIPIEVDRLRICYSSLDVTPTTQHVFYEEYSHNRWGFPKKIPSQDQQESALDLKRIFNRQHPSFLTFALDHGLLDNGNTYYWRSPYIVLGAPAADPFLPYAERAKSQVPLYLLSASAHRFHFYDAKSPGVVKGADPQRVIVQLDLTSLITPIEDELDEYKASEKKYDREREELMERLHQFNMRTPQTKMFPLARELARLKALAPVFPIEE